MHRLIRIADTMDRAVSRIGGLASWLVLLLVGVTLFDVVTRRFLVLGSTKLQEMEWHLHTGLFMLCLAWGYLKDVHVRVDLVRERLPPRVKAWIELLGCAGFLLPYTALILFFGFDFVRVSFEQGESSAAMTGLPYRWAIKSTILAGFALVFGAGLAVLLRKIVFLFGPASMDLEISDIREPGADERRELGD
jgi:TRAP-type mannitol/chloroaromatic compound transport system permease small subunit